MRNIGISIASKKKKNNNKFNELNSPIDKDSNNKKLTTNSLMNLSVLEILAIKAIRNNKVVSKINNRDIPSIPT
jgi:hypothetical protein